MDEYREGTEGDGVSKNVEIKLDGSYGLRDRSYVTLITKDAIEGEKSETFLFPSVLVDMRMLGGALRAGFIKGYTIVQQDAPPEEGR